MLQTGTSWQKKAIAVSPKAGGPLVEKGSALTDNITQLSFQQGCRGRQREQAEKEVTKSIAPHPQSWHDVKAEHDCSNTIAKLVLSQRDIQGDQFILKDSARPKGNSYFLIAKNV